MTIAAPILASGISAGSDPAVLAELNKPGISLAMWERAMPIELAGSLEALPAECLPRLRAKLRPREIIDAVRTACDEARSGDCAAILAVEVASLAERASRTFGAPVLQLRLDATEGQPCPKWHVDAVPWRVLCTLRGPGTEYGPIGKGGKPGEIRRMARGAVGAFRGALWPGCELGSIMHRSPPRSAGGPRLLLVIDPADKDEDF